MKAVHNGDNTIGKAFDLVIAHVKLQNESSSQQTCANIKSLSLVIAHVKLQNESSSQLDSPLSCSIKACDCSRKITK